MRLYEGGNSATLDFFYFIYAIIKNNYSRKEGSESMKVGVAALISVFCFAGDVGLLLEWNKSKKRIFLIGAIFVFVVFLMCIFYCAAALLLIGGID